MKLNKYLFFLITALAVSFTGCEEEKYIEPVVAPSVQLEYIPTPEASEIALKFFPSGSVTKFNYVIAIEPDQEAFLAGTLEDIRTVTVENSLPVEMLFTDLEELEVYTILAVGFAADGTAGPLATIRVKTRGPLTDIEVVPQFISERSAAIKISGSTNYYKYIFALGREGERESFEKGLLEGIREKNETSRYTATYFDLDMDSEYVFYMIAYDRLSNQPTGTIELPFKTAARGEVPAVEIELDHIDIYAGDYRIIPNDLCRKFGVAATLAGEFDEVYENENYKGDALEMLWAWERSRNGYVTLGYQTLPYQFATAELMLGDEDAFNHQIDFFIMVYGEGDEPVGIQKFVFETPAYDDTLGEAEVSVKITDIHDNGAMYEFILGDHAMGLVYETVDEEWYEQLLQSGSYYDGLMEDLIYESGYWNYVHGIKRTSFPEGTAQPGRRYRVFFMAMNYNGPFGGWSKMQSVSYTTTGQRVN